MYIYCLLSIAHCLSPVVLSLSHMQAAAQNGWLDEKKAVLEALLSIKRAGASFILTCPGAVRPKKGSKAIQPKKGSIARDT